MQRQQLRLLKVDLVFSTQIEPTYTVLIVRFVVHAYKKPVVSADQLEMNNLLHVSRS